MAAAFAVAIALRREYLDDQGHRAPLLLLSVYFWGAALLFIYTFIDNVFERPDGVIISSVFIVGILSFSAFSRYRRARELRVSEITFVDADSAELWKTMVGKKINLVPSSAARAAARARKADAIRHR